MAFSGNLLRHPLQLKKFKPSVDLELVLGNTCYLSI